MSTDEQHVLYLITNANNGKVYVGMSASSVERRFREHCLSARHGSEMVLHRAMRKHGEDKFSIALLEIATTRKLASKREIELIAELHSTDPTVGYNVSAGGTGVRHTVLTKQKISDTKKGIPCPLEQRERISKTLAGRKQTDETRAKRALAMFGHRHSDQTRQKMSQAALGRKNSAEHVRNSVKSRALARKHLVPIHAAVIASRAAGTSYELAVAAVNAEFGCSLSCAQAANIVSRHKLGLCGSCRVAESENT